MAQMRFIGYLDDLTQANLIWAVKALSTPGVKRGMDTVIDTTKLILTIRPGWCVMPDGFVIGETTDVSIDIFEPGYGKYELTLIAKRLSEPGMINDTVTYELVTGIHAYDSLANIENLIRIPLAWIYHEQDLSLPSPDNWVFRIANLGDKTPISFSELFPPFNEMITTPSSYPVTGIEQHIDSGTSQVIIDGPTYRQLSNSDGKLYLPIPKDSDSFISSIEFEGLCEADQFVTVKSLNALVSDNPAVYVSGTFNFNSGATPAVYTQQILTYPYRVYVFEDLLEISLSSPALLHLSKIVINRTRIFG